MLEIIDELFSNGMAIVSILGIVAVIITEIHLRITKRQRRNRQVTQAQ